MPSHPKKPDARASLPLTARQQAIVAFVRNEVLTKGYGPTTREIGEHFGIKSPNGVVSSLRAIEHKGVMKQAMKDGRRLARGWIFPNG